MNSYPYYEKLLKRSNVPCPFCGVKLQNIPSSVIYIRLEEHDCASTDEMKLHRRPPYEAVKINLAKLNKESNEPTNDSIIVEYINCTSCKNIGIIVHYPFEDRQVFLTTEHLSLGLPDNVPDDIKRDYIEAHATLGISPRASATLSRRCLQHMLREHFHVESTLGKEIELVYQKDNITEEEKESLMKIKSLGNYGAHPDKIIDINEEDAKIMLEGINLFMRKWYIEKYAEDKTLEAVSVVAAKKKEEEKKAGKSN